jgi:hypothetical protein
VSGQHAFERPIGKGQTQCVAQHGHAPGSPGASQPQHRGTQVQADCGTANMPGKESAAAGHVKRPGRRESRNHAHEPRHLRVILGANELGMLPKAQVPIVVLRRTAFVVRGGGGVVRKDGSRSAMSTIVPATSRSQAANPRPGSDPHLCQAISDAMLDHAANSGALRPSGSAAIRGQTTEREQADDGRRPTADEASVRA